MPELRIHGAIFILPGPSEGDGPWQFPSGAQVGTNGVNALALLGTNVLSAPVWRVDGGATPTNVCGSVTSDTDFLKRLARFLFEDYDLVYDTVAGDVHYLDDVDHRFLLGSYVSGKSSRRPDTVNCFDQAVSLCLLGRLGGVSNELMKMEPFGYLNPGRLIGIRTDCNNPFFNDPKAIFKTPLCNTNEIGRSNFIRHFFVRESGKVFDSCAGPARGTESLSEYVSRMVDTSLPDEHFWDDVEYTALGPVLVRKEGGNPANAKPVPYTVLPK